MQLEFGCSAVRQTGPGVNHNLSMMVVCVSVTVLWLMTGCCPCVQSSSPAPGCASQGVIGKQEGC